MSSEVAIRAKGVNKCYQIYSTPRDRLKQFILPRLQHTFKMAPRCYYEPYWALQNIDFEVRRGETVGVIGRNGSGKSTLLQIICSTLTPTSGNVETNGRIAALLELGSGFNPEFTGRENIFLNASILGLTAPQIADRFDAIATFADIGDFIEQPVKTYSSGMIVRLAFAVIAHVDADILVIDEALSVGDAFFTQKCMRFLRKFMENGTILFVSHDTASVRSLCNKAIWLDQGKILQMGDPKEICDQYLEAFYEDYQGKCQTKKRELITLDDLKKANFKDQRDAFINASNLRNDLEIFSFDQAAPSFGSGSAQITLAGLFDDSGSPLSWIVGGEDVALHIEILAHRDLFSPIVGFYVKDRLGQSLFGDNTWLSYMKNPVICKQGQLLIADFFFQMPRLPVGDYSITLAIAEGEQNDHIQHHWIHDAIMFKSESSSVAGGLIGLPMKSIQLQLKSKD